MKENETLKTTLETYPSFNLRENLAERIRTSIDESNLEHSSFKDVPATLNKEFDWEPNSEERFFWAEIFPASLKRIIKKDIKTKKLKKDFRKETGIIAKKIKIIHVKPDYWYYNLAGCIFDVIKETKDDYYVVIGGANNEFYINKNDAEVIKWTEKNDIKIGDKVKIIYGSKQPKYGFEYSPDKIYEVSEVNTNYIDISTTYIGVKDVPVLFPLSMIELIKNGYRPCKTIEEKLLFIGKKVRRKSDGAMKGMITGMYDNGFRLGSDGIIYVDSKEFLENYELLDSSPIGVKL